VAARLGRARGGSLTPGARWRGRRLSASRGGCARRRAARELLEGEERTCTTALASKCLRRGPRVGDGVALCGRSPARPSAFSDVARKAALERLDDRGAGAARGRSSGGLPVTVRVDVGSMGGPPACPDDGDVHPEAQHIAVDLPARQLVTLYCFNIDGGPDRRTLVSRAPPGR
jgi:hypothetical protein